MYEISLAGQRASMEGAMQNADLQFQRMNAYQNGQPIPANTGGYSNAPVTASGGASPPPGMPPLPPSLGTPTPTPSTGGSTGGTPTPTPTPSTGGGTPAPTPGTPAAVPTFDYNQAFNNFKNFIGYDFAFDEAMRALNHGYAASGQLQSGAAAKGIAEYAANMAQQMAAFPYLNYLGGQQAMGAQAASSIAGVGSNFGNTAAGMGQNYANSVGGINAGMGGAIQNGANALSNAAIANGMANANMWSGIGGGLGNLASSYAMMNAFGGGG